MKEKIAFVATGYGKQAKGGAEQHCRMLAERLVADYDVEVLTTCVEDYILGGNELQADVRDENGVCVRRFEAHPVQQELHKHYVRKSKWGRKLRKILFQLGVLRAIASVWPVWFLNRQLEQKVMQSYVFYSPRLLTYLQQNKHCYKAIIPINISYPLAYYASLCAPQKTILIPTMHYESSTFRSIYTEVFTKVAYIGFNTSAEEQLAERIFGKKISPHGIISVGIENTEDADWSTVQNKYNLPEEYILFVGRIDKGKLNRSVDYYLDYKKKYKHSELKLVLVGGLFSKPIEHPDIIYTGFVDESEKYAIIQHAKVFVNPSRLESLSLILLEGMSRGKAMLVNGKCDVLKEHCAKSGGAAWYYTDKKDFITKLHLLETSEELRDLMGKKGKLYVAREYDWDVIIERLKRVIEMIK